MNKKILFKKKVKKNLSGNTPNNTPSKGITIYKAPANQLVPDVYVCKMKYSERIAMAPVGGVLNTFPISGNSVYQPNILNGGKYPQGFAALSALYTSYRVVSSNISVDFASVGPGANVALVETAMSIEPTATTPVTIEAIRSAPYKVWKIQSTISNPLARLEMGISTHKIFGTDRSAILDDSRYTGQTGTSGGSSPSNNFVYNVAIQAVDRTSALSIWAYVEITYDVEFYNRVTFTSGN